jgi:hypothetical protein
LVENLGSRRRFRRKELERKRGRIPPHDVRDMHDSKLIFVRAATFGQLTEQIFDHETSSLNSKSLCRQTAIEQQRSHRPVAADDSRLKFVS